MTETMISKDEARILWDNEQHMELGKRILEAMPLHQQPRWAGRILTLVYQTSGLTHETIDSLLTIIDNPEQWKMAKPQFTVIRDYFLTLSEKRDRGTITPEENAINGTLVMAEQVAKVTYNATSPFDEFDEDSGYWIVKLLPGFIRTRSKQHTNFPQQAWETLMDFS